MVVGDLVGRVRAQLLAALDVGVDGAALDRARPHERDLDGDVVEVARLGARQHLHLGAALDLKDAGGLGGADRLVGRLVVERDPGEVEPLAAGAADLLDAALDGREHPEAEQVDLEEAGVGAGVLVPLDDLAALHRGGDDGADVEQRLGGDDHAARVLGGVAGQAERLAAEAGERAPALGLRALLADRRPDVALDRLGVAIDVDHPRDALDLPRRQAERLAEVADRAARAVGGEGGDEGRAVGAVALVDAGDQLLADVAREVEVDVGDRGDLLVEEAAGEEVGLDRVDVGEAAEVADDRGDAGAAAAAGRQDGAGGVRAADLDGDLARQLEQVAVQEEEAREAQLADDRELLAQAALGLGAVGGAGVAVGEQRVAEDGEVAVGVGVLGAGIAVAELAGEVEGEALGEAQGLGDGLGVVGEAGGHLGRGGEGRGVVAAALGARRPRAWC